jgi:ribulose-5-phosphate 4-epimerase/fuculose-1-phosphate aldolase
MLFRRDLTEFNGGNLSIRANQMLILSPTYAAEYFIWNLSEEDVIVLDPEFNIVRGKEDALSRDTELHKLIYENNPAIGSIIHFHTDMMISMDHYFDHGDFNGFLAKHRINKLMLDKNKADAPKPEQYVILNEMIVKADKSRTNVILLPHHGIMSVSHDVYENFRDIDIVASRLSYLVKRDILQAQSSISG